jgi:HTH-type transcriptional regulator/antitoxin HigA
MQITPIKSDRDYRKALKAIDRLMAAGPNTSEGDQLDVLTTLVESWEEKHHAIDTPDPVKSV